MTKSLAAVAACLAAAMPAAPAFAADWQLAGLSIAEGNRSVTYVDADSIRNVRGKVRYRSDRYLEYPENGISRISAVSEVDCVTMSVTHLRAQYYKGRALIGMANTPREESHYSSDSGSHWVVRRVCEGDYLAEASGDRYEDCERIFAMDWAPFPGRLALFVPVVRTGTAYATQMTATSSIGIAPK